VLGIVTVMLAAWTFFQQKRIEALQSAVEQAYRVQVDSLRATLERAITQTERSTAALNELARVEEGRVVEIRQFHEIVLVSIQALRTDVATLRGRAR
jgi:hypothetical protein